MVFFFIEDVVEDIFPEDFLTDCFIENKGTKWLGIKDWFLMGIERQNKTLREDDNSVWSRKKNVCIIKNKAILRIWFIGIKCCDTFPENRTQRTNT